MQRRRLAYVVLLHLVDVAVERAVSKHDQHDGAASLQQGGHDVGRVAHHGVLLLAPRAQLCPALVLGVEHPQLAGHVARGVHLPPVHEDLSLGTRQNTVTQRRPPSP